MKFMSAKRNFMTDWFSVAASSCRSAVGFAIVSAWLTLCGFHFTFKWFSNYFCHKILARKCKWNCRISPSAKCKQSPVDVDVFRKIRNVYFGTLASLYSFKRFICFGLFLGQSAVNDPESRPDTELREPWDEWRWKLNDRQSSHLPCNDLISNRNSSIQFHLAIFRYVFAWIANKQWVIPRRQNTRHNNKYWRK